VTRLFNKPSDFAEEALDGFVAAHRRWVRRVPGGVIRNTPSVAGNVAVIIGGGSGHYPAFSGLVGRGLAHGAAPGNVFASPSAQQVYSVAKAASSGGGVLLAFGNYAGDVLHFGQALDRLTADGIDCRAIAVTDDVASASSGEVAKRRGVAGDLAVFKIAGAAADAGFSLEDVTRLARMANERTRSFGIAFSGCTLPGASDPLFTVPHDRMAVGLGVHGEPGIGEQEVPSADELAEMLTATLLGELPPGVAAAKGEKAAVILNGLGTVKYEELFVVYRRVAQLLDEAGVEIVEPEVGEFVTSFDMAGLSLTLFWLNDELSPLWAAPADAPAFRKGAIEAPTGEVEERRDEFVQVDTVAAAAPESREAAKTVLAALESARQTIDANVEELGRIDSVAGDGDHGIGMARGSTAAVAAGHEAAAAGAGAGTVLAIAADAWADKAGGTSGALWGVALLAIGESIGDENKPDAARLSNAVTRAAEQVQRVGKAQVGDKTMVDALVPFSQTLAEQVRQGRSLAEAWSVAAEATEAAARNTADLVPKMGRARPLAEKSLGTPDPGAVSLAMIVRAVQGVLAEHQISPFDSQGGGSR
jgi:D-erythrulose 4-kinase